MHIIQELPREPLIWQQPIGSEAQFDLLGDQRLEAVARPTASHTLGEPLDRLPSKRYATRFGRRTAGEHRGDRVVGSLFA